MVTDVKINPVKLKRGYDKYFGLTEQEKNRIAKEKLFRYLLAKCKTCGEKNFECICPEAWDKIDHKTIIPKDYDIRNYDEEKLKPFELFFGV